MFPQKISTCVRCEKLKIQEKHTEPTTLELRRRLKRKMMRDFRAIPGEHVLTRSEVNAWAANVA